MPIFSQISQSNWIIIQCVALICLFVEAHVKNVLHNDFVKYSFNNCPVLGQLGTEFFQTGMMLDLIKPYSLIPV